VDQAYAQTLESFYEKVYIHTDKPYYYPGESIWFKGYINYKEPAWRDSLSRVIYVELISPEKKLIKSKTLKIDSGTFNNNFILADTLKKGTYYLRAYTNLGRNFGDSSLYVKPILILNITDKVDASQGKLEAVQSDRITITTDKKVYSPREKITLTIGVKDNDGKPLAANLSISVTDATQVVPLEESATILNGFPITKEDKLKITELKYPVERGLTLQGKFLNDNGKPEKAELTIIQLKPRNVMFIETDEQGNFTQGGLDFYDSTQFSIKADKAKDYPYGKVQVLPREPAPMYFKTREYSIAVQSTQTRQRIVSELDVPKDAQLLNTVEVKARKIEEEYQSDYRIKRPYGKPDYVLKAKDINRGYGNLLIALQGRIPGLIVREINESDGPRWVVSLQRSISISNPSEVLVTVNDAVVGGSPGKILEQIDPNTIETIEVKKGINVLYGSYGGNGILAIYTKQGASDNFVQQPNIQLINIIGYANTKSFISPIYSDPKTNKEIIDNRSTVYWNPEILTSNTTGVAEISFFTANQLSTYRIIVEGVDSKSTPVKWDSAFEIK
jgi:hypothetical protein